MEGYIKENDKLNRTINVKSPSNVVELKQKYVQSKAQANKLSKT